MTFSPDQPIKTTLKEFLQTGMIGPLTTALSMQEVQDLVGAPLDRTEPNPNRGKNKHSAEAWQYGCLEMGFRHGVVSYLGFDFNYQDLPDFLILHGYVPSGTTTLEEFIAYLDQEGITYTNFKRLSYEFATSLVIGAGATAVFSTEDGRLGTIYYSEVKLLND